MNIRSFLAAPALAVSLSACLMYQPPPPIGPATGVSLDRGPRGERSARQTRYLEEQAGIADPSIPPGTDPAAVQPPSSQPPPEGTTPAPATPPETAVPPAGGTGAATPPATPATPPAAAEIPYGTPVPGKKGFVYSPYDKSAGFVDVRDIGPGTKVRCPYTGKIFRVP